MSRCQRLPALLQLLRRHRQPIGGAPGRGHVMRPGFTLPPLMFSLDEVEALALGSRWVADRGDGRLAAAARDARAQVAAVLPAERRHELDTSALLVGPGAPIAAGDAEVATIRQAIRLDLSPRRPPPGDAFRRR